MAFNRNWDESLPTGSEAASDIDLLFRQLKEDIRERLEDVSTFGTDEDPLVLLEGTARLTVDTSGNKPGTPDKEGLLFYETDTGTLYVAEDDGGLAWVEITASSTTASNVIDVGAFADRPSSGLSPGQLYYATDDDYGTLFVAVDSSTWETVAPSPVAADYDPTGSAQDKISNVTGIRRIVTLFMEQVGIGSGGESTITIDETEFPAAGIDVEFDNIRMVMAEASPAFPSTDEASVASAEVDTGNNEINIVVTGTASSNASVKVLIVVDV